MEDRGARLERVVKEAMARQGIASLSELARRAPIGRDTLYGWFRGSQEPQPEPVARVCAVLGLTPEELLGSGPEASLAASVERLAAAIEALVDAMRSEPAPAAVAALEQEGRKVVRRVTAQSPSPRTGDPTRRGA